MPKSYLLRCGKSLNQLNLGILLRRNTAFALPVGAGFCIVGGLLFLRRNPAGGEAAKAAEPSAALTRLWVLRETATRQG